MNKKQSFYNYLTKSVILISFSAIFLLIGISSHVNAAATPNVTVTPAVVEYKPNVEVLIAGSGFEPKQKLRLFITMSGLPSGIHYMVKPEPIPNELGAFASVWTLRREISKKLIAPLPVVYTLEVRDKDDNTLCTAPMLFCDPKAKEKSAACGFLE